MVDFKQAGLSENRFDLNKRAMNLLETTRNVATCILRNAGLE
jgi:hypothetical protein